MPQQTLALLLAVAAASATMLGWVIAVARTHWPRRGIGVIIALAAAAMLVLSAVELLPAALRAGLGAGRVLLWVALGAAVVIALRLIAGRFATDGSSLQRSALLVAVALGVHNIPEGAAPYAATLVSVQTGLVTALAVGVHNIPEGLAIAGMAVAAGGSRRRAFILTGVATAGEIGGAMLAAFAAATISQDVAGGLIAFVGGIMITVSTVELLPSAVGLIRADPGADCDELTSTGS